ncbi:2Fe-2S iron-sulfur cluster-binding protein [Thermodesulfobacterium commune]|uniref:2Fe-2S ferredoxin-type domain-containing protein n=1 Tax=Thermodesulfobacterium commune DSM 2178 TaxID=289377 RepID=A0A075WW05_9BACT|nr:2Fe-2S iron-sulfur cluster-binding protein [Thermodesulfobacterium commune]AIH04673.1 hypothetical protein HL41_08410 [Thermodesulfobacterium commune DSM 2178]
MKEVQLTIDGISVKVPEGTTILEAAKKVGIKIPTLCYLNGVGLKHIKHDVGACRVCVVEVQGKNDLLSSCNTLVEEGMVVYTHTPRGHLSRELCLLIKSLYKHLPQFV